jgi:lipopolysaccharide export system permease protein
MALAFVIIAIPLSYIDPRRGRYTALIMAVLIYFTYSNLLKLMQAWVGSGKIDFMIGSWILHVIGALLGLGFVFYRQNRSITIYGRYKRFLNRRTSGGSSDVA